ncbi:RsmE family RNA methyltransferase [Mesoterricola sediminis]|uniref:Ribosomal RNA small subunit methyltransferase E n=1 Tax=Mesoterricola sediminis TaxID=2927980 RepID=A0AA48KE00_9BACT|nr:16S rRNA (uracil(1498)-N(3))-methyltransferase [Mesoterricola sediminis]BDU78741.1 ribosomal RNA small subunit methyltransferase E [Mesoterricola sediminis]
MSLPRFFLATPEPAAEGGLVRLDAGQARHLRALRLGPGAAVEVVLPSGAWLGDVAEAGRDAASIRLARPLDEPREAADPITVWLPLTAQLSLVDDMLPPVVELGAAEIRLVAWSRSEDDPRRTLARMERWQRIIQGACEQSHRNRIPVLAPPVPFRALLDASPAQRWVAYEVPAGTPNPGLGPGPIEIASGPEGGISDAEIGALKSAGWIPVSLGGSVLRAVTCPTALLGALRFLRP